MSLDLPMFMKECVSLLGESGAKATTSAEAAGGSICLIWGMVGRRQEKAWELFRMLACLTVLRVIRIRLHMVRVQPNGKKVRRVGGTSEEPWTATASAMASRMRALLVLLGLGSASRKAGGSSTKRRGGIAGGST